MNIKQKPAHNEVETNITGISIIGLVGAALLLFSAAAFSAESLKVAVVDIQEAMESSVHIDKLNQRLEQEFSPMQTDLKALEQDIRAMEERFVKDSQVMSEDEARRLQQEIAEKKSRLKFEGVELQRKVQKRQQELSMPLMKFAQEAIEELQKQGDYDLILHKQMTLYSKDSYDITKQLTEKLNKKQ